MTEATYHFDVRGMTREEAFAYIARELLKAKSDVIDVYVTGAAPELVEEFLAIGIAVDGRELPGGCH